MVIVVKRFITFVGLFCLLIVCLTGQAQIEEKNWNRIPENQKTAFLVSGPDNQVMYIQCFISTLENWQLLLGEKWEESKESTMAMQALLEDLFPGQTILFVWVTNGPRAQSFSPTNFVFTQGKQQYKVSLSDIWSCPALMDSLLLGRRNQNKSTVQAPKPPIPCDTRTPSAPAYVGFPCSTPW